MPSCYIKNCKSRTFHTNRKGITFFRFPTENNIRQIWIDACQRSEENLKIDSGNRHFKTIIK